MIKQNSIFKEWDLIDETGIEVELHELNLDIHGAVIDFIHKLLSNQRVIMLQTLL